MEQSNLQRGRPQEEFSEADFDLTVGDVMFLDYEGVEEIKLG